MTTNIKATYEGSNFYEENAKHSRVIDAIKRYFRGHASKEIAFLSDLNDKKCDFVIRFNKDDSSIVFGELKTNAGVDLEGIPFHTFIIESFKDNGRNELTDWRTAENLKYVCICNRYDKTLYWFDATILREYVASPLRTQTPSGKGAGGMKGNPGGLCGWGIRIPWESKEAGYLGLTYLEPFWNGKGVS